MATEDYIRALEQRLAQVESRLLGLENGNKTAGSDVPDSSADTASIASTEQAVKNDPQEKPASETEDSNNNPRPPLPPIELKVQNLSYIPFTYHALPADSQPLIEALYFPNGRKKAREERNTFYNTLESVKPDKAVQMIRDAYVPAGDFDMAHVAALRITSQPLGNILQSLWNAEPSMEHVLMYPPFNDPIYFFDGAKKKLAEMEAHAEQDPGPAPGDGPGTSSQTPSEPSLLEQLRFYVHLMEQEVIPFCEHFKTLSASDNATVQFDNLYHLFQPGDIIVYPGASTNHETGLGSNRGDQLLWRVYSRWGLSTSDQLVVNAYCIDYDGHSYVCSTQSFTIKRFDGAVSVTSLKVYPIRCASNMQSLLDDAKRRGEAFQRFTKTKLVTHNGWASEPNPSDPTLRYITGDVVIDFTETFKAHADCKPTTQLPDFDKSDTDKSSYTDQLLLFWTDGKALGESQEKWVWYSGEHPQTVEEKDYCYDEDNFLSYLFEGDQNEYTLSEEDLCLLPRRLFAYSLQDRRFVAVDVDNLKLIEYAQSKFDSLVINQKHERMLRALIQSHFSRKEIYDLTGNRITTQDIVHNKGRGLIILLHGVPGVGKTSTAETFANEFRKPLLPITCGDLGLDPATVEQSLKEMFRLAQLWDCVLLLDEADVFLTERIPSDLNRNALVSVFLRVLDYYAGVLFLTTNRVGTIDEAFKSRLHVSLYYPHLKPNQTEKIWQINLKRLGEIEAEQSRITGQPPMTVDYNGILEFARDHYRKGRDSGKGVWNGRQIRNAFLIASALARFEMGQGPDIPRSYDLSASHFKTVVEVGFGFEVYLQEVKGKSDGEAAFLQGTRAD
ncbi:P-loop containing nucleoside triphosphate hydrolase protein, partial [Aspergillus sclerotioniger CBS 115572]